MLFHEELLSKIKDSINNNKILHIKNFFDFNFSWEEIINILNYQYNNTQGQNNSPAQVINEPKNIYTNLVRPTQYFHFHMWNLSESFSEKSKIEEINSNIKDLMFYYRKLVNNEYRGVLKGIIDFVGNEFEGMPHSDVYNVLALQAVGSVKYNIYQESQKQYLIETNDLFFIPAGIKHQVEVFQPRSTIILDFK